MNDTTRKDVAVNKLCNIFSNNTFKKNGNSKKMLNGELASKRSKLSILIIRSKLLNVVNYSYFYILFDLIILFFFHTHS